MNALQTIDTSPEPLRLFEELPNYPPLARTLSAPNVKLEPLVEDAIPKARGERQRVQLALKSTPKPKVLFVRNTAANPPMIAKLACVDCSRTDFLTLQGLLNHCRLRHRRDYGSHEECINSCAVLVDGEERNWILVQGTELTMNFLPSMRRLFEIAVTGHDDALPLENTPESAEHITEDAPVDTHLSKTLGLHKDSRKLAAFLGRRALRRCINVHDESGSVDLFAADDRLPAWRMFYPHRNTARPQYDLAEEANLADDVAYHDPMETEPTKSAVTPSAAAAGSSRFHIVARITVTDRSQWIPPGNSDIAKDGTFLILKI